MHHDDNNDQHFQNEHNHLEENLLVSNLENDSNGSVINRHQLLTPSSATTNDSIINRNNILTPSSRSSKISTLPWWKKLPFLSPRRESDQVYLNNDDLTNLDNDTEIGDINSNLSSRNKSNCVGTKVKCFGLSSIILILLCSFTYYLAVPDFGQTIIDESTLVVSRMHMKNPTLTTITLNVSVELHDIGQFSSTVHSAQMDVYHDGYVLGYMTLPQLNITGGQVYSFNFERIMTVTNVSAFTTATAQILQGAGGIWFIKGNPIVKVDIVGGITKSFQVNMNKQFLVPATLLEDVKGYDTQVLPQSNANSFNVSSKTSLFSSSILELYHLGLFIFELQVLVDDENKLLSNSKYPKKITSNQSQNIIKIGKIYVHDFDLRQGMNVMDVIGNVEKVEGDDIQQKVLSQFFSNYMNGFDQKAILKGPIQAASPFLTDVVTQILTFTGMTEPPPVTFSYLDASTMNGFTTTIPSERNKKKGKKVHYRGTVIVGHNPLSVHIQQSKITSQVHFVDALGYRLNNPLLGKWDCPKSYDFAELYSAPGMWAYFNKSFSNYPPVIDMKPNEQLTFYLPGRPRKNQLSKNHVNLEVSKLLVIMIVVWFLYNRQLHAELNVKIQKHFM